MIATTSSDEKAEQLKKLGAHHVLNYRNDPNWGETAKSLTPDGEGVHHVLEVAGPASMKQSLKAIKMDGVISIIGFVGGGLKPGEQPPSFLDCLSTLCVARGVYVGSRAQFEDMNRAIEMNDIHPVIDSKVFKLEELKEAYQYMVSALLLVAASVVRSGCSSRLQLDCIALLCWRCSAQTLTRLL